MVHYIFLQHVQNYFHNLIEALLCLQGELYDNKIELYVQLTKLKTFQKIQSIKNKREQK